MIWITETSGLTNSILKIIWFVSVFNFLLLGLFYEEHMKGEQVLSDYIDSSTDINANVMLTENETVTFVFKAEEPYSASETLSIVVVDPQNSEYTLEKDLSVSAVRGRNGALIET